MSCKHEHLRTVGDRLFCKDCGDELPIEFLTEGSQEVQPEKPVKKAPAKKAPAKKKGE